MKFAHVDSIKLHQKLYCIVSFTLGICSTLYPAQRVVIPDVAQAVTQASKEQADKLDFESINDEIHHEVLCKLLSAISWSRFEEAEDLLKLVSINDQFKNGDTVIMHCRFIPCAEWCINHGADVFITDHDGKSLYDYAEETLIQKGSEFFCFLIDHNRRIKKSYKEILISPEVNLPPELSDIILSYMPSPTSHQINGALAAASKNFEDLQISYLLNNGANCNYVHEGLSLIMIVLTEAIEPRYIYGIPQEKVVKCLTVLCEHDAPFTENEIRRFLNWYPFKSAVLLQMLSEKIPKMLLHLK